MEFYPAETIDSLNQMQYLNQYNTFKEYECRIILLILQRPHCAPQYSFAASARIAVRMKEGDMIEWLALRLLLADVRLECVNGNEQRCDAQRQQEPRNYTSAEKKLCIIYLCLPPESISRWALTLPARESQPTKSWSSWLPDRRSRNAARILGQDRSQEKINTNWFDLVIANGHVGDRQTKRARRNDWQPISRFGRPLSDY